jgi:hypothetical protein
MNPRDTFVNPLLTNISVAYSNEDYIAGKLFPTVEVDKETGLYFVVDKENLRAPADARRSEFGRANRVSNTLTQAAYALEEKSLEAPISDRVMRQYDDPFNPKANATKLVKDKLLLDKEKDLAATIAASTVSGNNLDTSASWATAATDILAQIRTGRTFIQKSTGKKANTVLLSKDSYDAIMKNTAFIAAVQYTSFPSESQLRAKLAEWFDVERVLVGEAVENTAKEGQTDVLDYIWKDLAVVAYVAPNPALETPSAGYELKLKGAEFVDEWYEQEIKTTFVRNNDFYDNKVVDKTALYIITNTV